MPARKQTQLKASTQKYIHALYQQPTLKFLKGGEPWEPIADLIYGPVGLYTDKFFNEDVRQAGFNDLLSFRRYGRNFAPISSKRNSSMRPEKNHGVLDSIEIAVPVTGKRHGIRTLCGM